MIRSSVGGDTPQIYRSPEGPGIKPLFHSVRDIALILDKTVQKGYGVLKAGTMMAKNTATGLLVPYVTDDYTDANVGRSYLVQDVASAAGVCYVRKEDAYKFVVGDSLILVRDNSSSPEYHDGGAITAIDVDTSPVMAEITFTTAIAAVSTFSIANGVNCYVKSGASGKFSTCAYVLDKDIDTGTGSGAKGANTSVVMNNAILYTASLVNYDSSALSDLGAVEDGRFVILK
jgi:hypothetical protein